MKQVIRSTRLLISLILLVGAIWFNGVLADRNQCGYTSVFTFCSHAT